MKKILTIILAILILAVLVACSGKEDPPLPVSAAPMAPSDPAPAAPAPAVSEEAAPPAPGASGEVPPPKPESEASGEAAESSQEQKLEAFPSDGYPKTFDGYIQWVCAALESQPSNPKLAEELAAVQAVTEDTYNPDAMPFSMQIRFGLITSYEDFLG